MEVSPLRGDLEGSAKWLFVVREMEWNADDTDNADFHCVTLCKLCETL
mgnify:FL=1